MKSAIGAKEELEASLAENKQSREVANVVFVFAQGLEEFLQAFDIDLRRDDLVLIEVPWVRDSKTLCELSAGA